MAGFLPPWLRPSADQYNQTAPFRTKANLPSKNSVNKKINSTQKGFYDPEDSRIYYRFSNKARRISLRVHPSDRQVTVIVPSQRALPKAKAFVREKMDWINVQLEGLPEAQPFIDGHRILFEGEQYNVHVPGPRGRPDIDRDNKALIIPASEDTLTGRGLRLLKREARAALEESTEFYADKLGKTVAKISIRDSKTRWGSCITRKGEGHISYSWRLICAPPFVLDYVCAHECAHMIHADHSANFWALTEEIFPETNKAKAWLRKNGARLHAVGMEH